MKKIILYFVNISVVFSSCTLQPTQVCDTFNSSYYSDTCALIDTKIDSAINISQARTITYFLNTGCSICIADFCTFMRNIDDYAFDSLIIIAGEAYDFIQSEFYLNRDGLTLPPNTRIVFDPENNIFDKMHETYGFQNIFLVEQNRILMYYNTQGFYYDDKYGYCFKQEK